MGVSLPELAVVFVVVLLVFGPDKLPEIARTLGKLAGDLRKASDSVRREFYNSVYTPADEVRSQLRSGARELRSVMMSDLSDPGTKKAQDKPAADSSNPAAKDQVTKNE